MSYRLMPAVWRAAIEPLEKLILLRLADHADENGESIWPAVPSVAHACGCSERSVQRSMRKLQDLGLLVLVREADFGARRPCEYRIDTARVDQMAHDRCQAGTGDTVSPVTVSREPVTHSHPTGDTQSPKPSIEPSKEPSMDIPARACSTPAQPDMLMQSEFDAFWKIYPRRDGRALAEKAYTKALKRGASPADIEEGARLYVAKINRDRTERQFVAMPATWLNGSRWTDESLRTIEPSPLRPASSRPGIMDLARELADEVPRDDLPSYSPAFDQEANDD